MEKTSGENNPNWRNGSKQNPYCDVWLDQEFKESIKKSHEYKCQNPECEGKSEILHIHHIDYNKLNCHPSNLITLCNSCHSKANFDREEHKVKYKRIAKSIVSSQPVTFNTN